MKKFVCTFLIVIVGAVFSVVYPALVEGISPYFLAVYPMTSALEKKMAFIGIGYLLVNTLIIVTIISGSYFGNYDTTQDLVKNLKNPTKSSVSTSSFWNFMLSIRWYLLLVAGSLIVSKSFTATVELTRLDFFDTKSKTACIGLVLILVGFKALISREEKHRLVFFIQSLGFIMLNATFFAFEAVISGFGIDFFTYITAAVSFSLIISIGSSRLKRYPRVNKIVTRKLFQLARYLKISTSRQSLATSKSYYMAYYAFLVISSSLVYQCTYLKLFQSQFPGENISWILITSCIWIYLAVRFLRISFEYSLKGAINKIDVVPLDFLVLFYGLVYPLLKIFYLTWVEVNSQSLVGLGVTFLKPGEVCVVKEVPELVVSIASPSESFWKILTIAPQTVKGIYEGIATASQHVEERARREAVIRDQDKLNDLAPELRQASTIVSDPSAKDALQEAREIIYYSEKARYSTEEQEKAVAKGFSLISKVVNSSPEFKGCCPVSPRSGLVKSEQYKECLKNLILINKNKDIGDLE